MSNVTSQSELTTKEIVEQAISDYHMSILPYLAKGNNGYSETPIGAMQMFDDDTAPSGWLVADGTVYNISDYPFLANHFERVHGSKNYYGGNGTTTFAVPDWQGEFFRATNTSLLCCIKAVPAGINYSTEEQPIGTWIDGKKIYKRTWNGLNLSISPSSWTITDFDSTNIKQILSAQGTKSSAGLCIPLEANPTENNHTKVGILGHRADSGIDSITLQYTKTTDV